MKRVRSLFFILLLAVVSAGPLSLEGADLFAVIVADTFEMSIGEAAAQDLAKMKKEVGKIAAYTGLGLKEIILKGTKAHPEELLKQLDHLTVQPEDMILFYFSGHGFRTSEMEDAPWPNLYFSQVSRGIELKLVAEKLEEKHPRFLLLIADACNSFIPDDYAPPLFYKMIRSLQSDELIVENYRSLFLESRGMITITSSEIGEPSWGTWSGSFFTKAFLRSLDEVVRSKDYPSWEEILYRSAEAVSGLQHPIWEIIPK